jgi:hypothetical protein
MWATLALAAVLQPVPAQGTKLAITNVRNTYGILGQERKSSELLPGDIFVVSFDIEGLQVKDSGEVEYSMSMELKDKEGKSQFKKEPQDLKAFNALGGNRLPAFAMTDIGLDTPPGEYTLTVNVVDRGSKDKPKTELVRKFTVSPKKFGIVSLVMTNEAGTMPMPPVGVVGETLRVNFLAVGFELGGDKKQPNLTFEMRVLDDAGKPTFAKPVTDSITTADEQTNKRYPMSYLVPLNRKGSYTIALKVTDNISKKTVEEKLSITVHEPK